MQGCTLVLERRGKSENGIGNVPMTVFGLVIIVSCLRVHEEIEESKLRLMEWINQNKGTLRVMFNSAFMRKWLELRKVNQRREVMSSCQT